MPPQAKLSYSEIISKRCRGAAFGRLQTPHFVNINFASVQSTNKHLLNGPLSCQALNMCHFVLTSTVVGGHSVRAISHYGAGARGGRPSA